MTDNTIDHRQPISRKKMKGRLESKSQFTTATWDQQQIEDIKTSENSTRKIQIRLPRYQVLWNQQLDFVFIIKAPVSGRHR